MNSSRLVSIVIPAYKADFFEAALVSAMRQNHDEIEIVVTDDCRNDSIRTIVEQKRESSRFPIRYFRNDSSLGEALNAARGVSLAQGDYVKFLYDDDILVPDCVRLLFDVMERNPNISIATSARRVIDENGEFLQGYSVTAFPFEHNVVLDGPEVASFLSQWPLNFIGEPTCVMCRRADVLAYGDEIMSLNGESIHWLGDVALYLKLLRQGDVAMLQRPLSYFRVSNLQSSNHARENPGISDAGHANHYKMTHELGWRREIADNKLVKVAPLSNPENFTRMDLHACFTWESPIATANQKVNAWVGKHAPTTVQQTLINRYMDLNEGGPSFGIVISDPHNQPDRLMTTLTSLVNACPSFARLHILVLSPRNDLPRSVFGQRLQWLECKAYDKPAVLNQVLQEYDFDWMVQVSAGSVFTLGGLQRTAIKILDEPGCRAIYGDEIVRQSSGVKGLAFRPDFNLDYLLSLPMAMSKHWFFNRQSALDAGGFNAALPQALELDLILRLIESEGLEGLAHVTEPLVEYDADPLEENPDEIAAIQRHLYTRGYQNSSVAQPQRKLYRVNYGHTHQPLVSIIIPTRDQLSYLQRCIESIFEKTSYPHYEIIIVDNNSEAEDAVQWLAGVEAMQDAKIRVLRYPHAFNYSAINNMAAQQARGEYLVLLNNDTAVLHNDWLENLLNHALRPEVGIVGAKLLYLNGTVQHAGVVMGLNGPASHLFITQPGDAQGYMQRLQTDQNYSAVTGACLMIRKSLYEEVNGLEETDFKVSYNDVDLCLKVKATGHLTVWTPYTVLLHEAHVSQSKLDTEEQAIKDARFAQEKDAIYKKWLPAMLRDPAYNENLWANGQNAQLETNNELTWRPLSWRPLPVVLVQPLRAPGLGSERLTAPLASLRNDMKVDAILCHEHLSIPQILRLNPDSIVIQRPINAEELQNLQLLKTFTKTFKVYDLEQYPHSALRPSAHGQDIHAQLREGLSLVDRVVVPTEALAAVLSDIHGDIQVIPTRLDADRWANLKSLRRTGNKPRVGWIGSADQADDLALIAEVIKQLANTVDWIVMGPCPANLRPYVRELRTAVDGELRPGILASLNLDLAVAPARQTLINESKSNLALLELGACAVPVICSDVGCYKGDLSVTRVANQAQAWLEAIQAHINDLDTAEKMGDQLKQQVKNDWLLQDVNLDAWKKIWLGE